MSACATTLERSGVAARLCTGSRGSVGSPPYPGRALAEVSSGVYAGGSEFSRTYGVRSPAAGESWVKSRGSSSALPRSALNSLYS